VPRLPYKSEAAQFSPGRIPLTASGHGAIFEPGPADDDRMTVKANSASGIAVSERPPGKEVDGPVFSLNCQDQKIYRQLKISFLIRPSFFILFAFVSLLAVFLGQESEAREGEKSILVYPPRSHALGHRATSTHLKMFLGRSARFDDPRGIDCVKLNAWDDPDSDSDDDELCVVLANSGRNEIIFNNSMASITKSEGDAGVKFTNPADVAIDASGNLFVADSATGSILKFRLDDKNRLKFISRITGGSKLDDRLLEPSGICSSYDDTVYVADRLRNDILMFDRDGNFIRFLEGKGSGENHLFQPIDIDVLCADDPWNFFKRNSIFVLDKNGKRIRKYSTDGKQEAIVEVENIGIEGVVLSSIASDYYAQIYATDVKNHCIHKFDRNLDYLGSYGNKGTGDGEFIAPKAITIWKRFGQVFVADSIGVQYLWIGTDVNLPEAKEKQHAVIRKNERGRKTMQVSIVIAEPSELSFSIQDTRGKETPIVGWRKYFPRRVDLTLPFKWDQEEKPDSAKLVIRARATYSSKESFEKKLTLPVKVLY